MDFYFVRIKIMEHSNLEDLEILSKKLYKIYCENVGCVSMSGELLLDTNTFFSNKDTEKQANAWREVAKYLNNII